MAKVTGPLLSIGASGSVASLFTFRTTKHGAVVQRHSVPTGEPSTWQEQERQAMRYAAQVWAELDDNTRTIWASPSVPTTNTAFMSFFQEFRRQRLGEWDTPKIPATFIGIPTTY